MVPYGAVAVTAVGKGGSMQRYEAARWVREHQPTVAQLRCMIDRTDDSGMSCINPFYTRRNALRGMRCILDGLAEMHGEDFQILPSDGRDFIAARDIAMECMSAPVQDSTV